MFHCIKKMKRDLANHLELTKSFFWVVLVCYTGCSVPMPEEERCKLMVKNRSGSSITAVVLASEKHGQGTRTLLEADEIAAADSITMSLNLKDISYRTLSITAQHRGSRKETSISFLDPRGKRIKSTAGKLVVSFEFFDEKESKGVIEVSPKVRLSGYIYRGTAPPGEETSISRKENRLQLGGHEIIVRPFSSQNTISSMKDEAGEDHYLECGKAAVRISKGELFVNGRSYGKIAKGSSVIIDGEDVVVSKNSGETTKAGNEAEEPE